MDVLVVVRRSLCAHHHVPSLLSVPGATACGDSPLWRWALAGRLAFERRPFLPWWCGGSGFSESVSTNWVDWPETDNSGSGVTGGSGAWAAAVLGRLPQTLTHQRRVSARWCRREGIGVLVSAWSMATTEHFADGVGRRALWRPGSGCSVGGGGREWRLWNERIETPLLGPVGKFQMVTYALQIYNRLISSNG